MATTTRRASGTRTEPRRRSAGASALKSAAAAAITPEALLDLVGRLGLTDMLVDRVRARVQEVELDEIFDDLSDYLRRNPEALVVVLGALTVASGIIVYMGKRNDGRPSGRTDVADDIMLESVTGASSARRTDAGTERRPRNRMS